MFVFIMTAFYTRLYRCNSSAGSGDRLETGAVVADRYGDLIWAFFALAYSTFAVQFDQFVSSLGVNLSRGGSSNGTSILSAIGASAMMLRRGIGRGSAGGGLDTPFGSAFSKNWNALKSAVVDGSRAGFAGGSTKGEAFAMGAMGAAKGFAGSTNIAKAAAIANASPFVCHRQILTVPLPLHFLKAFQFLEKALPNGVTNPPPALPLPILCVTYRRSTYGTRYTGTVLLPPLLN